MFRGVFYYRILKDVQVNGKKAREVEKKYQNTPEHGGFEGVRIAPDGKITLPLWERNFYRLRGFVNDYSHVIKRGRVLMWVEWEDKTVEGFVVKPHKVETVYMGFIPSDMVDKAYYIF